MPLDRASAFAPAFDAPPPVRTALNMWADRAPMASSHAVFAPFVDGPFVLPATLAPSPPVHPHTDTTPTGKASARAYGRVASQSHRK